MIVVSKCMLGVFRPSFEVVKEGRILKKIKQLETQIEGSFLFRDYWPTQNQEVTTSKIVTFFLVPGFDWKWGVFDQKNELEILLPYKSIICISMLEKRRVYCQHNYYLWNRFENLQEGTAMI